MFVEGFRSRYFPLKQWLLRRGHQASSNITWERVRHSNSHCPLQGPPHQGLRAGPSDLCFCSTLKRESHCSPRTTSFPLPHSSLHQASIVTCTLHVRTSDPGVHQVAQGSGLPTGFSLYQLLLKPLGCGEGRAPETTGT